MDKITVNDLYNWMDEMEENPITDGPVMLSRKDELEFMGLLDKSIIDEDNFDFLSIGGGRFTDKQESYLVNLFVNFLNEKGYDNDYIN
jgi:hypothetical protein